jgi:disulfide bond formation protein DsbB
MRGSRSLGTFHAAMIGIIVPTTLLATAIAMQKALGLFPCEMCLKQRTALWVATGLSMLALMTRRNVTGRIATVSGAMAMASSASIAVHQAGGERGWWKLHTACGSTVTTGEDMLSQIMKAPFVRCDVPQWRMAGMSLADLNALICIAAATAMISIMALAARRKRRSEP